MNIRALTRSFSLQRYNNFVIPARDKWRKSYFYPISRINLIHVSLKFRDHHSTSIGDLWAFGGQKFSFRFLMRFYNNAAKIFGAEEVLCRRLENLEGTMVYTTRGSICITRVSARMYFFEKSFRVPKIKNKFVPPFHLLLRHVFARLRGIMWVVL